MKSHFFSKVCMGLLVLLSLSACGTTIEPVEIKSAAVLIHKKPDGSLIKQPKSAALNKQQTQFVQGWLNNYREGWSSHKPMATLLPQWCISLQTINDLSLGLCRYEKRVVLRGIGSEIEHPLSESDISSFSQNIEANNGFDSYSGMDVGPATQ